MDSATPPLAPLASLTGEQRAQLEDTPPGDRLELLATWLAEPGETLLPRLAAAAGLPPDPATAADPDALRDFPARILLEYCVAPVGPAADGAVTLACAWPPDAVMRDWLATFTTRPLRWCLAPAPRIRQLLHEQHGIGAGSLDDVSGPDAAPGEAGHQLGDEDTDAATITFVREILAQALKEGATDVHFEPQEKQLRIRYRIDGILVAMPVPPSLSRYRDAIISRLKIMARLNISERRLPQDGRFSFRVGPNLVDVRISTMPTVHAESVSLRLLNRTVASYTVASLGLGEAELRLVRQVIDFPHGIVLLTGPTGSGKSTTLNAFLQELNSAELRLVTIEDPIEFDLPGANQVQLRPEIDFTFASALRHVLRQDPDVIMVGEIRDRETAEIAIRASLTGHLVFSTLHTNDAPGAITRLVDMGIEPFLVTSGLQLVIAQRLVRRLCPRCARPAPVDRRALRDTLATLGVDPAEADTIDILPVAVGCEHCRQTGYRGRLGIFELFRVDHTLHDAILAGQTSAELGRLARQQGMRPLGAAGWARVRAGETTADELRRTIMAQDR